MSWPPRTGLRGVLLNRYLLRRTELETLVLAREGRNLFGVWCLLFSSSSSPRLLPLAFFPGVCIRYDGSGRHSCTPPMIPTLVPPGLRTTAWVVPSGPYSIRPSICPPCWSIFTRLDCTSSTRNTSMVEGSGVWEISEVFVVSAAWLEAVVGDPAGCPLPPSLPPSPRPCRPSASRFFRCSSSDAPPDPCAPWAPRPPTSISAQPSVATSTRPPSPCLKSSHAWAMSCSRRRTERSSAGYGVVDEE